MSSKEFFLILITLSMTLITSFYATHLFYSGYHNTDTAVNMMLLNAEYGLDLEDMNTDFEIYDADTIYIRGLNYMRGSLFVSFLSGFLLMFTAVLIVGNMLENK